MDHTSLSRRGVLSAPALLFQSDAKAAGATPPKGHVVCVGGHPDDPESGCGGTLALYQQQGYQATAVYLTRGERGIRGKTAAEAAQIRTAEALAACKILNVAAVFAGQVNGAAEFNAERQSAFNALMSPLQPTLLITHWLVDTHPDHQIAAALTYQWWLSQGRKIPLLFFEVETGEQTQQFHPTFYVDIASTWEKKKAACYAHVSQKPDSFYGKHERMEKFRGVELGVPRAEAFIVHALGPLPPSPNA